MSDTSKQVAGPLRVSAFSKCDCIVDAEGQQIAQVNDRRSFNGNSLEAVNERHAYARLFAASTDLRDALREARKVLAVAIRANWEGATDEDIASHLTIKQIDAAISRATGETA